MLPSTISKTKGGCRWYLVISKRGREKLAKENLERQGFEVYLPMYVDHALGRTTPRPFLPRYLFVAMDINADRWRGIFSTYGVHDVYCIGSGVDRQPLPVPWWMIEELQRREMNGLIVLSEAPPKHPLLPGDPVRARVIGVDLEAVFVEKVDERRAVILVSVLGSDSKRLNVPLKSISRSPSD